MKSAQWENKVIDVRDMLRLMYRIRPIRLKIKSLPDRAFFYASLLILDTAALAFYASRETDPLTGWIGLGLTVFCNYHLIKKS